MNKKFYVAPEMEETDLKIATYLQTMSGGDPNINQNWSGGDGPIEWPEDEQEIRCFKHNNTQ